MDLWARILFLVLGLALVVTCLWAMVAVDDWFLRPRFPVIPGLAGGLLLLGALVVDGVKRPRKPRR
ncbi:hypothetical protein C5B85_18785 [Pseudoclavibacter sp. AY1F1]|nr:hypothetical protein C5B85_18785 [Pseudoclavibacter sp. AY1F1]